MKEIIQRQLFDYLQTLGVKNLVGVPDSTMKHFIDQGLKKNNEVENIKNCAKFAKQLNIICNAGHGLNFDNVIPIASIMEISELNIGHSIISSSIFNGLENTIKKMINIIKTCRYKN